jgi:hypothetical protein
MGLKIPPSYGHPPYQGGQERSSGKWMEIEKIKILDLL